MAALARAVPLLRFSKEGISAVITYGTNPIGAELRFEVDGPFTWSRTCRTSDGLRIDQRSTLSASTRVVRRAAK